MPVCECSHYTLVVRHRREHDVAMEDLMRGEKVIVPTGCKTLRYPICTTPQNAFSEELEGDTRGKSMHSLKQCASDVEGS